MRRLEGKRYMRFPAMHSAKTKTWHDIVEHMMENKVENKLKEKYACAANEDF